jgi:hypothetical protein
MTDNNDKVEIKTVRKDGKLVSVAVNGYIPYQNIDIKTADDVLVQHVQQGFACNTNPTTGICGQHTVHVAQNGRLRQVISKGTIKAEWINGYVPNQEIIKKYYRKGITLKSNRLKF